MTFRESIIGTWELVEYFRLDDEGERVYPLGQDATGFLMYNPDGYMSAQLMGQERPEYTLEGLHNGTTEEMAQAAHRYHAYSGKFEVDEANETVYHHNTVSLIPNRLGAVEDRRIERVSENEIAITSSLSTTNIRWRKAEDNTNNDYQI